MKRSGQVALVLMGVTGATAAGAYMLPTRPECRAPQPAPVRDIMDLGKPAVQQGVAPPGAQPAVQQQAAQQQPCSRSTSSGSRGWHWYSHSNSYDRTTSSGRPPNSTSVGFTSNNSSLHSGSGTGSSSSFSSSSSSSSAARGGFGSTGHAMSGGGHSGS
jgi:hypothetical protein